MESTSKFCGHCGAPLPKDVRFCVRCGQAVQTAPASPAAGSAPPPPSAADFAPPVPPPDTLATSAPAATSVAQAGEPILAILPSLSRSSGFMGLKQESFNLLITPHRLVFVAMSGEMMKQAVAEARERAKEQGKGFMGQWSAQMGWLQIVIDRYTGMTPEDVLRQYAGSFAVPLTIVRQMRIHQPYSNDDEPAARPELRMDTTSSKFKFTLGTSAGDAQKLLRQHLGGLVR